MPPPPDLDRLLAQIQFPGMTLYESEVAMLWLRGHGAEYDRIEFNYRLGDGATPLPGLDPAIARMTTLVTQKRADIMAWLGDQVTIIEAKIRAGLGPVGQLAGYRDLYLRANPGAPAPRLLVIAKFADPDARFVFQQNGIDLALYERANSQPDA